MSGEFGELVLICGDFCIPSRSSQIHEQFKALLVPNKMHHLLCTGNIVTKAQEDFLRTLAPSVHIVRGDQDSLEVFPDFPEQKVVKIGEFRIGITHGHQIVPSGNYEALANVQRQLDTDLLVYGNTHKTDFYEHHGRFLVSPGSITGSYTVENTSTTPGFILLVLKGKTAVFYIYQLVDGEVQVSRSEFVKKD